MDQFLTARFFQGMGSCFIFIGYALVHELFDDRDAVKLTTILSNAGIFAPLIGPVVGSAIVSQLHWKYVFLVSLLLGTISFVGLFRFMPAGRPSSRHFDFVAIRKSYAKIFSNRQFMFGILLAGMSIVPLTAWIGLSPVIVMDHMQQSYGTYILYQCIIFSGFVLSTIAVQKLAEDFSLKKLIRQGAWVALTGMSGLGMAYQHSELFILGMFIFSVGFGLFNGALVRLSMTATGESMSLTSSAMSLMYCIYISVGLEIYNLVCETFSYSLASYALFNVPLGVAIFLGLMWFIKGREEEQPALAASA
jgi:DHA1 family multidrug/chloramphenicol efflux transport protein-like MFS transporter